MNSFSIIVQGEGKGHFSQAMEILSVLGKNGAKPERIYLGKSVFRKRSAYYKSSANLKIKTFFSPNFIRTRDKKGIRVFLSLVANLLLTPLYVFEAFRLGMLMRRDKSNTVLNFYDPVGAIAAKLLKKKALKISISHHFYLSHNDFTHPFGMDSSFFWLQFMNRIMMSSADRLLALSFRGGDKEGKIEVVPPLIETRIRSASVNPGKRDLCYFLNPGFLSEIIHYYRMNPDLEADIFTDAGSIPDVPGNVRILVPSREQFLEIMCNCRRIISTAGFDLVAEAFYLGIPVFLVPSLNHYEQYCNALDAARTGMAIQLESLSDLSELDFEPVSNKRFRDWVDQEQSPIQRLLAPAQS